MHEEEIKTLTDGMKTIKEYVNRLADVMIDMCKGLLMLQIDINQVRHNTATIGEGLEEHYKTTNGIINRLELITELLANEKK